MKVFRFKADEKLAKDIEVNCSNGEMSKFIRDAIKEKLERKKIEDDEDMDILKMIKKIDPELLKNKLIDNELMTQTLYEEIKKISKVVVAIYKILGIKNDK